jgi:hypothetical protein
MDHRVECRSDFEYAQQPVALYWQGKRLQVSQVLGAWRTPQGKRFFVRSEDGQQFELTYDEASDQWVISQ